MSWLTVCHSGTHDLFQGSAVEFDCKEGKESLHLLSKKIRKIIFLDIQASFFNTRNVCAYWVYTYLPTLRFGHFRWTLDTAFQHFLLTSQFELMWIQKNLVPDDASLNLKTELATLTTAPESTDVAVPAMPRDTLSIRITFHSLRCTINRRGVYLYQSATHHLRWAASTDAWPVYLK